MSRIDFRGVHPASLRWSKTGPSFRATTFLLVVFLISLSYPTRASAEVIRPFTTRFEANTAGEIYLIGNVNVHAGSEVAGNNNNYAMLNVDIDGNAATFNSSSADFMLPPGATVLWAGLYWGADTEVIAGTVAAPDYNSRDRVLFNTGSGYQTITSQIPLDQNSGGYRYQGFAEVTNLIRTQSAGSTRTYTTANIQAATNTGNSHYAGWTLIVAISDPAEVLRHLHVFDGFAQVDPSTPTVTTSVTGFRTPLAGTFNTHVGMVAYEGDLASSGDLFQVNGTNISNTLNPWNNFFNSSITREDVRLTAKTPDYINQLGFDIDVVDVPYASGIIRNGDTSANLTFAMTGDWYYPGALTFAIDIYDPVLQGNIAKSMVDLNGGALYGNDEVEFTIRLGNTGNDNATNVVLTDPIPPDTTYVPGSLSVSLGPNLGAKSDVAGDDQAEYDALNNRVVFRMGSGANSVNGGTVGINEWTEAKFRVRIASTVPPGTTISNSATVDFIGEVSGLPFTATSNLYQAVAGLYCDLEVGKTVADSVRGEGLTTTFTVTVHNNGPDDATEVVVNDILPGGFLLQTATPSQGTYNAGSGVWSVGTLANGSTATLDLLVEIAAGAGSLPQPLVNSASASAKQIDTDTTNNGASASLIALAPSDLSTSTKLVADLNGGDIEFGDVLRYTLVLTESSGNPARLVQVTDIIPANVTAFTVIPPLPPGASDHSTPDGTGGNASGFLDIRDITVPGGGSVSITFEVTVSGAMGAAIDNTATIINPGGPGATPSAPSLVIAGSLIPGSGNKHLYLYNAASTPAYKLSRTPMAVSSTSYVAIPRGNNSQTWTLSPTLQSDVTISSGTIPVRLWMTTSSERNYTIPVRLYCGATQVAVDTQTYRLYLNATPLPFDFNLNLASDYTCPAGSSWALSVTNTQGTGAALRDIRVFPAPSSGNTSNLSLPSQNVINVDSIAIFDSVGTLLSGAAAPGDLIHIRATVSDPFGSYDISAARLTLTDPLGTVQVSAQPMAFFSDSSAATKIFEYSYTLDTAAEPGSWTIRVDADEGSEGTVSDYGMGTLLVAKPLPALTVLKSSSVYSDPVNGITAPKAIPGAVVVYTITTTNFGAGSPDTDSMVYSDPIPADTSLFVDNLGQGEPVFFLDTDADSGFTAPPLPFSLFYSSRADCNNFGYTPVSSGGYDANVCRLRIQMLGTINGSNGTTTPDFSLQFRVRIE